MRDDPSRRSHPSADRSAAHDVPSLRQLHTQDHCPAKFGSCGFCRAEFCPAELQSNVSVVLHRLLCYLARDSIVAVDGTHLHAHWSAAVTAAAPSRALGRPLSTTGRRTAPACLDRARRAGWHLPPLRSGRRGQPGGSTWRARGMFIPLCLIGFPPTAPKNNGKNDPMHHVPLNCVKIIAMSQSATPLNT